MCLQNLMKFHQRFLKLLRKQNVTDTRSVGRSDNVKTVYSPTNTVCGGYNKGYPVLMVVYEATTYEKKIMHMQTTQVQES